LLRLHNWKEGEESVLGSLLALGKKEKKEEKRRTKEMLGFVDLGREKKEVTVTAISCHVRKKSGKKKKRGGN